MADEHGPTDPHGVHFTPQERRILAVLADGEAHHLDELFRQCVDDQLSGPVALMVSVSKLRRKLERRSQTIVIDRARCYRHVQYLSVVRVNG